MRRERRENENEDAAPIAGKVARFAHYLRDAGLPVSPAQTLDFVHCLPLIDAADRRAVRDAGRAIFVRSYDQLALFDRAFDRFWSPGLLDPSAKRGLLDDRRRQPVWEAGAVEAADLGEGPEIGLDRTRAWSAAERLRTVDFGELSAAEAATVQEAMRGLARRLPTRRTRRLEPARRGQRINLRVTLRKSLRTAGDPLRLVRRGRRIKPRPLVLLCDVSGSMEHYARTLLQFAYALTGAQTQVEAFVFATQLTRVTRQLQMQAGLKKTQAALDAAVAAATDWGSGTRIGPCLRTLRTRWPQALGRGAIVLLISDGCDRGDIALLAQELAAVRRRCHRLLWLNPWLGQDGYQPAVRGMQAALPHIDDLLPVHNLQSLEELVAYIVKEF
jgi:uncharacterized protein with von Willebrand factor type A (vWA) domain